jgi:hypothetical protein
MMRTFLGSALSSLLILFGMVSPSMAWEETDQQAYYNKMSLLKVMLEGARMRAVETNDLETLCLIMSIGNDVTVRYVELNPNDVEVNNRLDGMRNDMTACLALLYNNSQLVSLRSPMTSFRLASNSFKQIQAFLV